MVAIKRTTIAVGVVAVVVVVLMIMGVVRYRRWRTRESYVAAILPPMGQPISQDLQDSIQAYQMSFVDAYAATTFAYDPRRDGKRMVPNMPGIRSPVNASERKILGYYQYQCANLMGQLANHMPLDPRYVRLTHNFSRMYVAIDISGNQGMMHINSDGTGTSVMAVNITAPIAKNLNVIAHEMAHCALPASSPAHNQIHTDTWKLFVHIGTKFCDWKFVQFSYPNCCQWFNICDLREFDQTKVFATGPTMQPWGQKLVKWAA